ncbi:MAG: 2-amino-4-hydroxy-6-hydroxymethyldihydropteridine pyrophosphokinase [Phycisphaerales bacterium]|nr:2-amino-4-hydroxy-6-hydroxymethyldihydropteridine pyrophosphokinase [Phycisphaerales bacterium]
MLDVPDPAPNTPRLPTRAFIAAGSNLPSPLGDPRAHIDAARNAIHQLPVTRMTGMSQVFETDPVGPRDQPRYLNAVFEVTTSLTPRRLLDSLLEIERSRGRDRSREERWGPRTLDLDLLLYGDLVIHEPGLVIPHPRMHERSFVLDPLAQLAPDLLIPGQSRPVIDLARALRKA